MTEFVVTAGRTFLNKESIFLIYFFFVLQFIILCKNQQIYAKNIILIITIFKITIKTTSCFISFWLAAAGVGGVTQGKKRKCDCFGETTRAQEEEWRRSQRVTRWVATVFVSNLKFRSTMSYLTWLHTKLYVHFYLFTYLMSQAKPVFP